jgi:hypothetical protein
MRPCGLLFFLLSRTHALYRVSDVPAEICNLADPTEFGGERCLCGIGSDARGLLHDKRGLLVRCRFFWNKRNLFNVSAIALELLSQVQGKYLSTADNVC